MLSSLLTFAAFAPLAFASPIEKREYSGPVLPDNFPDPSLIQVGDTWYSFATGPGPAGDLPPAVPFATSTDFKSWKLNAGSGVISRLGKWAIPSGVWAPDILQLKDGSFVMYYTAQAPAPEGDKRAYHCIGAATSKKIEGPYEPQDGALACPIADGGAIDASGFTDSDGTVYVVYKVDGNNIGPGGNCNNGNKKGQKPTPIMLQKMKANGFEPDGQPQVILDRDNNDGPLVEAPSLAKVDNSYFLFFSSNCYSGPDYDTSYAVSTNGIGNGGKQYAKAHKPDAPLLRTGKLYAPGGLSIAKDGKHVAFHADKGKTADVRQMYVGTVTIDTGKGTVTI